MRLKRKFIRVGIIFTVLLLGICAWNVAMAEEQVTTKQRTTGTYLPVLAQQKFEKLIDINSGGEVALDDGGAEIIIPENIYKSNLKYSVRRVQWNGNSAIPALDLQGKEFMGNDVFEITATDIETGLPVVKFDKDITITFRYFDEEIEGLNENSLQARYYDRQQQVWVPIEGKNDSDKNSLSVKVNHLTLFAVVGDVSSASQPDTDGQESNGIAYWQKILLILGIISLSGLGGWYIVATYIQMKKEKEMEEGISIAGGSANQEYDLQQEENKDNQKISSELNTNNTTDAQLNSEKSKDKKDDDPPDENKEIWIEF